MLARIYNRFRRITTNQLYFPEIDGIRFLAITLVILFHAHGYFVKKTAIHFADAGSWFWLDTLLTNGDRGVELFFVLSGFILCLPFAHHYINNGKAISLKKYYLRRVTRLEPPYFIALTALLLMQLAMHVHPAAELLPSWGASLIYSHNILFHHTPLLTVVAWSLEIEIQFYVLAPILFRLLSLKPMVRRVLLLLLIAGLACMQRVYPPAHDMPTIYGFAQYFITGILLSDFYVSDAAAVLFGKGVMALLALPLLLLICYLPIKEMDQPVAPDILFTARLALPFIIGLFYYIVLKNPQVKKLFSYKLIPIIGGMCYSIYLLHYTIISIFGRFTVGITLTNYYLPNLLLQLTLLSLPILLISAIFYLYIERPFMDKKWLDMLLRRKERE